MSKRLDPAIKAAKRKAYKARYYKKNKTRILKRNEEYYRQNSEKIERQKFKYYLRYKFEMEPEQYTQMLENQQHKCAICGYLAPENATCTEKLYVDHDHSNGNVRGLLCMNCNSALGHFKENLTILKNAVNYLENYEQEPCNNTASTERSSPSECGCP